MYPPYYGVRKLLVSDKIHNYLKVDIRRTSISNTMMHVEYYRLNLNMSQASPIVSGTYSKSSMGEFNHILTHTTHSKTLS